MIRTEKTKDDFASEIINCKYREIVLDRWLHLALEDIYISEFFQINNLNNIAIYGYGKIGKMLCCELQKCKDLNIVAVIDVNYQNKDQGQGFKVISPSLQVPDHDVLVSTIADTNLVRNIMECKSRNIIGIDELLKGFAVV